MNTLASVCGWLVVLLVVVSQDTAAVRAETPDRLEQRLMRFRCPPGAKKKTTYRNPDAGSRGKVQRIECRKRTVGRWVYHGPVFYRLPWDGDESRSFVRENYRDGKLHGQRAKYRIDNVHDRIEYAEKTTYRLGVIHGPAAVLGIKGRVLARGNFGNGKKSGRWDYYYDSGKPKETGRYLRGVRVGKWTEYTKDGRRTTGKYINGKKHGDWIEHDEKGRPRRACSYSAGNFSRCVPLSPPFKCPSGTVFYGNPPPYGTEAMCLKADKTRHGPYRRWTKSGELAEKGQYREGSKHGLWTTYWSDRMIETQRHYKNGLLHGPYKNLLRHISGQYRLGKKHGRWREVKGRGAYQNGKRVGTWKLSTDRDKTGCDHQIVTYKAGVKHGPFRCTRQTDMGNTEHVRSGAFRNGKRHGLWRWGAFAPEKTVEYKDGKKHGHYKEYASIWDGNGSTPSSPKVTKDCLYRNDRLQGCFRRGKRHGRWQIWGPNGKVIKRCQYVDGVYRGCQRVEEN